MSWQKSFSLLHTRSRLLRPHPPHPSPSTTRLQSCDWSQIRLAKVVMLSIDCWDYATNSLSVSVRSALVVTIIVTQLTLRRRKKDVITQLVCRNNCVKLILRTNEVFKVVCLRLNDSNDCLLEYYDCFFPNRDQLSRRRKS